MLEKFKSWMGRARLSDEQFARQRDEILKQTPVPVFWLFGKTGSGKTSIVKYLTGADEAVIGSGFRPQTRFSQMYSFPSPEAPVLKFLDTRGLGESGYDCREDLQQFDEQAHVMIVPVRVTDHALGMLVEPLAELRRQHRHRPVLLAITCLHECYPQRPHPQPDPFVDRDLLGAEQQQWDSLPLPDDLRRSLREQVQRFAGLVDCVVPIDLTLAEDGFAEPNFGGDRLKQALLELLPATYRQTLLSLTEVMQPLKELHLRQAMPLVFSYSSMAATAAAVPVPWVDIPVVVTLQSHLVHRLAAIYDQKLTGDTLLKLAGSVGSRALARMALRGPMKLVPLVGVTANAALAFAHTLALGRACCWYFGEVQAGATPREGELREIYAEQFKRATNIWKRHREEPE